MKNDFQNSKYFPITCFIFITIFISIDHARAASYCESIFRKGQVEAYIPMDSKATSGLRDNDFNTAFTAIRKYEADPTDLLRLAHQRLNQFNVRHDEMNQKQRKIFRSGERHYLEISVKGDHPLNQLAKQLFEAYGTRLLYEPAQLGKKTISFYQTKGNVIYLSHYQALSGQIDFTLLHEIGHVAMTKKEDDFDSGIRNKVPMVNGSFQTFMPIWPWGLSLPHGYKKEMDLQEYHNYRKTYLYRIIHAEQELKNNKLTTLDLIRLRKIDDDRFRLISQEIKKMYDYEIMTLPENPPGVVEFRNGHLFILDMNFSYVVRFLIPRQFLIQWFKDHYPLVNSDQLESYILNYKNRGDVMELILDYLIAARSNLERKTKEIELRKSRILDFINLTIERRKNGQP